MAAPASREDLLACLPDEILNAEEVSQEDLIKFAPVLAHQQMEAYQKKIMDEQEIQNSNSPQEITERETGGFIKLCKNNPMAVIGACGALLCLGKGLGEFGGGGSVTRQMVWMKRRLYSQSLCVVCCVVGHSYGIQKYNERQELKKQKYEMERLHICQRTGMSIEEFEEMRHREATEREQSSQAHDDMHRAQSGDYFTPEQRREIEIAIKQQRL